jgi:hypothetical protein
LGEAPLSLEPGYKEAGNGNSALGVGFRRIVAATTADEECRKRAVTADRGEVPVARVRNSGFQRRVNSNVFAADGVACDARSALSYALRFTLTKNSAQSR